MSLNISILKNSKFSVFFISDILSGFGVGMATLSANWYVLMKTGESSSVGTLLAVNVIAGFITTIILGGVVDRIPRKTLIFWTHLLRAIGFIGIFFLLHFYGFHLFVLYAFSAINGIGWTLYIASSRSLLQEILDENSYVQGNSLLEVSLQVGMFLAAGAAGVLYNYCSFAGILLIITAMFIASAVAIIFLNHQSQIFIDKKEDYLSSLQGGVQFLSRNKIIFLLGIISIVPLIVTMMYNVVLPEYVNNTLRKGSVTFGLADMSYGIGGLVSGVLISLFSRKLKSEKLIGLLFLIAAVNLLCLSHNTVTFNLYLCSLVLGISNSSLRILIGAILMKLVSKQYMGRMMSVILGISLIFQCGLSLSIGAYIDHKGSTFGLVIMGMVMLVGFILYCFEQIAIKRICNPLIQKNE
ncbi:MFS transporter [Vibrio eleionomae]|nr:MFS transporter [Vibrio eleionomae]